jgi:hypothetical protein
MKVKLLPGMLVFRVLDRKIYKVVKRLKNGVKAINPENNKETTIIEFNEDILSVKKLAERLIGDAL